jgi:hypothetical protein
MFPSQYARNITVLGVFLNFYWLWHFVKHFVDLLVCNFVCVYLQVDLLISALGFMMMNLYMYCNNKQEDTVMEHTSTICNMIDKPKHLRSNFIHK